MKLIAALILFIVAVFSLIKWGKKDDDDFDQWRFV